MDDTKQNFDPTARESSQTELDMLEHHDCARVADFWHDYDCWGYGSDGWVDGGGGGGGDEMLRTLDGAAAMRGGPC